MLELWNTYLYEPVFNFLIWIYNNWADQNMGWAVVYLTVSLRLLLLPLTIITERNKVKNSNLANEVERLSKGYKYDPVLQKEEIRRHLKTRKVKPWAKSLSLGIQALVLVLLYQVFIQGISGERMVKTLYSFIDFPGVINRMFYGFDLGKTHDLFWAGIIVVWILIEIYIEFKKEKRPLDQRDLFYFILFPASVFAFLYFLPMVKSLFIFTSMVFSVVVHYVVQIFLPKPKNSDDTEKPATA